MLFSTHQAGGNLDVGMLTTPLAMNWQNYIACCGGSGGTLRQLINGRKPWANMVSVYVGSTAYGWTSGGAASAPYDFVVFQPQNFSGQLGFTVMTN